MRSYPSISVSSGSRDYHLAGLCAGLFQRLGTTACLEKLISRAHEDLAQGNPTGEFVVDDKNGWPPRHPSKFSVAFRVKLAKLCSAQSHATMHNPTSKLDVEMNLYFH